jgi:hypothetical protein
MGELLFGVGRLQKLHYVYRDFTFSAKIFAFGKSGKRETFIIRTL